MTVWIHSPFDNLPAEGFRTERYWLMAEAFRSAGHRVIYLTSDFNHGTKKPRVLLSPLPPEVVLVPTRPYARNVCLARIRSHRAYARDLAAATASLPRPDLVITAVPTLGAADAMRRLARQHGARFVVDVQDAWPETFYRLLPPRFKSLGTLIFAPLFSTARRLYREADLVTGVSRRYAALTARRDYVLAYHGIAPHLADVSRPAGSNGRTRLVYVGNLGAGYDLKTVIEAVRKNDALSLDIAGKGPQENALRALGAPRVTFHGYLGETNLRALLAACDVGVVPMRDDSWVGLPYKLGDYLAAELPVVSSLHGECGELLTAHDLGETYDWGSADSLLAALTRLRPGRRTLPDALRADCIYPAYVTRLSEVQNSTVQEPWVRQQARTASTVGST